MVKITVTEASNTGHLRRIQNDWPKKARDKIKKLLPFGCLTLCCDSHEYNPVPQRSPRRHEASPLKPKSAFPLKPKSASPLKPKSASPLKPKSASPLKPKSASPLKPKSASPLKPKSASPLKPKSASPHTHQNAVPLEPKSASPLKPVIASPHTPKKHRQPNFNSKEQEAILRYIVENNAYGNVGGNKLWKAMKEAEVCKGRSAQSMRNHYLKKLEYVLETFSEVLTPQEIKCLRLRKPVEDSEVSVELLDSSNLENAAIVKPKIRKVKRSKTFRKPYSEEDDRAIINFINDNNGYELVKGRLFWERMAQTRLIEGRTWQALKERFQKHIYPTLDSFALDDATLKLFNDGWNHRRCLGDALQEKQHNQLIQGVEGFNPDSLRKTETQEKVVLPKAEDVQQEKTQQALLKGVEQFDPSQLRHAETQEKVVLPDKDDVLQEKTHQNVLQGVESFNKSALKHADTKEKLILPDTEVIAQEKGHQQLVAGIESFDTSKLKHTETQEKNPLPTQEAIQQEKSA